MTDKIMSIREMCESFNVTPRTLRFYESRGLISPMRAGQKRLFSRRDRARLALILRGKRFGFSLEDIGDFLSMHGMEDEGAAQLDHILNLARARLRAMEAQQTELGDAITELRLQIARGEARRERHRRDATS
jgi:DNA-binding transcriptional MerR regulator